MSDAPVSIASLTARMGSFMAAAGHGWRRILGSGKFLAAVLVVATTLRVWHVLEVRGLPLFDRLIIDSEVYDAWAQAIAAGDWSSSIIGRPFYMDPLYSYFLAAVYRTLGRDLLVVRFLQVGFGVATVALVAVLGRQLRDAASGNLAALMMAVYRPSIFQEGEFEKTALGVFLATAALVLFLVRSPRSRLGAGIATGLATLTRGNFLMMAPFAVAYLLVRRDPKSAVAFLLGITVSIAPATIRNRYVGGEWVLAGSAIGQNLYTGNNPSNPDGAYHSVPFVRPQAAHEEGDFLREAERRTGRPLSAREASSFWVDETLEHLKESPGFFASVTARKLGLFWSDVEIPDAWDIDFISRFSLPLRLPLLSFSALAGLAMLGVFAVHRTEAGRLVIGYVMIYCASVVAFFVFSRYRLHVVPALATLAGCGVIWAVEIARQRRFGMLSVSVSLALLAGTASAMSFPSRRHEASSNYAALAEIYQEQQDFEGARRILGQGLSVFPQDANLLCGVGKLCLRSGDAPCAMEFTGRCLRTNANFPEAWYLRGRACELSGDGDCARRAYQEQIRRLPGHEGALERLR